MAKAVPGGEKVIDVKPLKLGKSIIGHITGDVREASIKLDILIDEKLVGLENPI